MMMQLIYSLRATCWRIDKWWKFIVGMLALGFCGVPVYANLFESSHNYVQFEVGYNRPTIANNSNQLIPTVTNLPADIDKLTFVKNSPYVSIEGGQYWRVMRPYFSRVAWGALLQYGQTQVQGDIQEYGQANMDNYTYRTDVSQLALLGTLATDVVRLGRLSWFVKGGVGVTHNTASNYIEQAKIRPARENLNFANQGDWCLAYLVSSGLRWQLSPQTVVGLSYEYLNTGKATLGSSTIRPGVAGPEVKLHNHLTLFTFTYLF